MAGDLAKTDTKIRLDMMSYFVSFALGEWFRSPVSERAGRKPLIYVVLAIFVVPVLLGRLAAFAVLPPQPRPGYGCSTTPFSIADTISTRAASSRRRLS